MRERLLSLERYSREYNLRFHNVPESTNDDCVQKVRDILSNQLDMEPGIENAHRVGPRNDDKPRVIICKFLYRPQRYKVIQKKRDLEDGICPTVIGCCYWNDIPLSIREKTTKKLFKRALFNYYLAQY